MVYPHVRKSGDVRIAGFENLMRLLMRLKKYGVQNVNVDQVWDDSEMPQLSSRSISSDQAKHGNELANLRRSLDEAKICMAALNDVRDHLAKRVEHLRNACIPMVLEDGISNLPNQMLSHIFEHGHDMSKDSKEWKFAKCVSQVSSRFRQVSLRTPMLWSRISSFFPDDQVQVFLSRSRAKDLEISALYDRNLRKKSFAKILRPHLNRVVRLQIDDAGTIEHFRLNNLPRLRGLHCESQANLSSWHLPLLSQIRGKYFFDGLATFQAQLTCVDFSFMGVPDLVSFSQAVGLMTSLKNLSVNLWHLGDESDLLEIPGRCDLHTVHVETLKITINEFASPIHAARLYDALGFLFPSTVEVVLDNVMDRFPPDFLRNSAGNIFPYGSTIKIRFSAAGFSFRSWDQSALLPTLVAACDVAHTIHIEAPMAPLLKGPSLLFTPARIDRKLFASLRHLQLGYCDRLFESDVQLLADKLIRGADPQKGLQSLEILSCRYISEKFLLKLGAKVGPKLKWKL